MRIESGVTKRALLRQGMVVGLLLVFAAWFGWDGWVGYPKTNMEDAKKNFPVVPEGPVGQSAEVTQESVQQFKDQLKDSSHPLMIADLNRKWSDPQYLGAAEANGGGGKAAFYVGTCGWAKVAMSGDAVTDITWQSASNNASSILVQKLLAAALVVGAMIPLGILLGRMSGKYVLDDKGLTLSGGQPIRYEQMTAIDLADLQKKGLVRLKYKNDKGQDATAVLDEEMIEKFEDIVLNLCEKKNWQSQLEEAAAQVESPPDENKPQ